MASSFLLDHAQAGFRIPRYGETAQEYKESTEKYVEAVKKHREARRAHNLSVRKGPLARSSNDNRDDHHQHNDDDDDHDDKACSKELMAARSQMYIEAQPVSPTAWTEFFSVLHPDVILGSNLIDAPNAVGQAAVQRLLMGINTQYQRISELIGTPFNSFAHNTITTTLRKAQGSLRVGVQYNISIFQEITFSDAPECLVTSVFEFADAGKTLETLSLELAADPSALTCERIKWVCGEHLPNFGNPENNCMLLWMHSPAFLQADTAVLDDLQIITPSRTLSCANSLLSTIVNGGAAIPDAEVAFLCSLLGAPIEGLPGCWAQ